MSCRILQCAPLLLCAAHQGPFSCLSCFVLVCPRVSRPRLSIRLSCQGLFGVLAISLRLFVLRLLLILGVLAALSFLFLAPFLLALPLALCFFLLLLVLMHHRFALAGSLAVVMIG